MTNTNQTLLTAPLQVPKKGEKVYSLDESEIEGILKRRGSSSGLDPGMGGVSPAVLDDLMKTGVSDLVSVDLAITSACNFKCGHCYRPGGEWGKKATPFPVLTKVIEEAIVNLGVRYFVLTGGEPTIYTDGGNCKDENETWEDKKSYFSVVDKIIEVSKRVGANAQILTFSDVAPITAKKAKMLADRKVALCLKRDTLDHEVANGILGVKRGSQQMLKGYDNLFAAGYGSNPELAVSVNQVLRKGEFNTLIGSVDLHLWIKDNGMHHSVIPIHYCGEAIDEDQTLGLNPLEVKAVYDIMAAIDDLRYDQPWEVHSAFTMDKTCNRPGRGVHVRSTGDVTSCSESPLIGPYIFGNVLGKRPGLPTELTDMIRSKKWEDFKVDFGKRNGKYICNPEVCDFNATNLCRGGCAVRSAYSSIDVDTGYIVPNTNQEAYTEGREDPMCPGWVVLAQKQGVLREGVYETEIDKRLDESQMIDPLMKLRVKAKVMEDFEALRNTMSYA
jgi:hypothetical protein